MATKRQLAIAEYTHGDSWGHLYVCALERVILGMAPRAMNVHDGVMLLMNYAWHTGQPLDMVRLPTEWAALVAPALHAGLYLGLHTPRRAQSIIGSAIRHGMLTKTYDGYIGLVPEVHRLAVEMVDRWLLEREAAFMAIAGIRG